MASQTAGPDYQASEKAISSLARHCRKDDRSLTTSIPRQVSSGRDQLTPRCLLIVNRSRRVLPKIHGRCLSAMRYETRRKGLRSQREFIDY